MTKTTKIAVLLSSCIGAIIGLKAWDFLTMYPGIALWKAILAGLGYVAVLFIVVAVLVGLATWWLER